MGRLSYEETANASGVGKFTIMRFENGENTPKSDSLDKLKKFYESKGVEFLAYDGVRLRPTGTFRELRGAEGFKEFIYDVYGTVKDAGGEVCITNVDERLFERWQGPHAKDYISKMASVGNLVFCALVEDGDNYLPAYEYTEYRSLPSKYFSSVPTYVYGTKKAEILFDEDDVTILLLNNKKSADAQRKYFSLLWENAKPVDARPVKD